MATYTDSPAACIHGQPFTMTCESCGRILAGANIYVTTCVHGVDLRYAPRCYLCKPEEALSGETVASSWARKDVDRLLWLLTSIEYQARHR